MESRRLVVLASAVGVVVLGIGCSTAEHLAAAATVETGDLVFQRSRSAQAEAISRATGSDYTHVGVVLVRDGEPFVLEAAATVRFTPYEAWVARGVDGDVVVKRLRDRSTRISAADASRMRRVARSFVGRPYDTRFEWSDDRIYCSELVYKIYERGAGIRLGAMRRAGDFALGSAPVRRLIERRFGRRGTPRFDPDEPVLSPAAMLEDPALVTVHTR